MAAQVVRVRIGIRRTAAVAAVAVVAAAPAPAQTAVLAAFMAQVAAVAALQDRLLEMAALVLKALSLLHIHRSLLQLVCRALVLLVRR
jgi:hypothetical protein